MTPKMNHQERTDDRSSERAQVVIRAIVEHGTMAGAATALGVSTHSVDAQLDLLRAQVGLRYLPQLVAWAASQGWLDGLPKRAV